MMIDQLAVIQSWIATCKEIQEGVPPSVMEVAIADNPWFTPYFIEKSLQGILSWDETQLDQFLAAREKRAPKPQKVGIIAAGNVPLVGLHDVLMTLLVGHEPWVKCSRQDKALMQWWINTWQDHLGTAATIHLVDSLPETDFLIATGSNNTARYISAHYPQPKLIRRNRYSVAWLRPDISSQSLTRLADDIFLYNGLGCRNVSNIWVWPGVKLDILFQKLDEYPIDRLNTHYLERLLFIKARAKALDLPGERRSFLYAEQVSRPLPASMGILHIQYVSGEDEANRLLATYRDDIQCVVGHTVDYGSSQEPRLSDFADGVDTYKVLTQLG